MIRKPTEEDLKAGWHHNFEYMQYLQKKVETETREQISLEVIDALLQRINNENLIERIERLEGYAWLDGKYIDNISEWLKERMQI